MKDSLQILVLAGIGDVNPIKIALEAAGHIVVASDEHEAALDLLRSFRPDIALIDTSAKTYDPAHILIRMRRLALRDLKVVGFGPTVNANREARLKSAGFDARIHSPTDLHALAILKGLGTKLDSL